MWELLTRYFQRFPAQSRVAQTLLTQGLSVRAEGVFSGEVAISDTALARACNVDRRIISATVETIRREPELLRFYSQLAPTCNLRAAAPVLGWGVIEIIPSDAREPGILSHVAGVMARRNISVRQAIVEDPELTEAPRLYVITEQRVPLDVIEEIRQGRGVKGVTIS